MCVYSLPRSEQRTRDRDGRRASPAFFRDNLYEKCSASNSPPPPLFPRRRRVRNFEENRRKVVRRRNRVVPVSLSPTVSRSFSFSRPPDAYTGIPVSNGIFARPRTTLAASPRISAKLINPPPLPFLSLSVLGRVTGRKNYYFAYYTPEANYTRLNSSRPILSRSPILSRFFFLPHPARGG